MATDKFDVKDSSDWLSECCGAHAVYELGDAINDNGRQVKGGYCSACGMHAGFVQEDGEKDRPLPPLPKREYECPQCSKLIDLDNKLAQAGNHGDSPFLVCVDCGTPSVFDEESMSFRALDAPPAVKKALVLNLQLATMFASHIVEKFGYERGYWNGASQALMHANNNIMFGYRFPYVS